MIATNNLLKLSDVTYKYPRSEHGVEHVSLSAPSGGIYGLLGPNGAGKTTIMRLMTGLLMPDSGEVFILDVALRTKRHELLSAVGSLIEVPSVYHHLTAREHLQVFAHYMGAPRKSIDRTLEQVDLIEVADRKVGTYSLGMKQRLAIATALLHDPQILVLDEPTNGLDPMGIVEIRNLMRTLTLDHGKTVVVSSHLLPEVEKMATHVGIVHEGKMRFEGTFEQLRHSRAATSILRLRVSSATSAMTAIRSAELSQGGDALRLPINDDSDAAKAIASLVTAGVDVYEASRESSSLERDFLSVIEEQGDAEQP
jgi:lantibiotic transport system ATP-binding protein